MIEVRTPANQFFDTDGTPLDAGYIYVGTTGANPETTPQTVYWDKAGAIPAAQPIRTLNGYPSRDGAVSKFYTSTKNYSITVKDKRGILVQSVLNSDSGIFDELSDESAAASIGYENAASGLAATNVQAAIDEVKEDITEARGLITDLSASFSGVVNLFANSAFFINERGYVSGTPTVAANQYTIDRIRVVVSGQSLTITAAAFGNKITAPAGGAEQVIEGIFITGGDYACTWTGTGTVQVNGTFYAKNETFTLSAGTTATVRLVGEFEKFMFTRPDMISRYEYDYSRDSQYCRRYAKTKNVRWRYDATWNTAVGLYFTDHFEQMRAAPAATILADASSNFSTPSLLSSKPSCAVWALTTAAAGPTSRELDFSVVYTAEL